MKVVGLDLSLTHTGYAILNEKGIVLMSGVTKSKSCGPKPTDEAQRIVKIASDVMEKIDSFLPHHGDILFVIEGLAYMAQGISLIQLSGLNYIVRSLLLELEIPFLIVAPLSLKKFITGFGKGDKDMMMMSVYKNYGFESMDNNECDAYSLAVCGLAVLEKPIKKLGVPQKEVINLLKKQL